MARPSVVPKILSALELYLEQAEREWLAQPTGGRRPTLPLTNDGKVNVSQLVEALDLPPSYTQHFYKPEIAGVVNVVADAQSVKRIGSRALAEAEDDASKAHIAKLAAETKRQTEGHSQSRVRVLNLERENAELRSEVERLRRRLRLTQETGRTVRSEDIVE